MDKYSKILEDRARADGLNIRYQYTKKEPTGTCAVLITGNERSLCANLAAATCFSPSHIEESENKKLVEMAEYIYVSVCINLNLLILRFGSLIKFRPDIKHNILNFRVFS